MLKFPKQIIRLSTLSFTSSNICLVQRLFSSQRLVPAAEILAETLKKEINHERQNYGLDMKIEEYIKQNQIDVIDENDESFIIEMKREMQDKAKSLYIRFKAKNPNPIHQTNEFLEQDQRMWEKIQSYLKFSLSVVDNKDNSALIFECATMDTEIQINNIAYSENYSKYFKDNEETLKRPYAGPLFSSLDDQLQKYLLDYLKEHGVEEYLAAFIENYALEREQKLYMNWLNMCAIHAKVSE